MPLSQQAKGKVIAVVFVLLLVLPATYGLIRAFWGKDNSKPVKDSATTAPAKPVK